MSRRSNETIATTMDGSEDEESFVDLMDVGNLLANKTLALSLTPKNDTIGVKSELTSALICATIKARTLPEENERAPVDIVVALDISSSMTGGEKLGLCKLTIEQLLRNLLPHDRFGLITYSDDAVIKAHLQFMTNENKQKVLSTVKNLHAHGSTNISAAIALSFQELQSVTTPNKIRSIFLLTDGNANRGITDQKGLTDLTKNCWYDSKYASSDTFSWKDDDTKPAFNPRPSILTSFLHSAKGRTAPPCEVITTSQDHDFSPVSLLCFGYGIDHNAPMLRDVSEATETGSYYFVQTDSDVSSAFGDALGGLVSIVAQSAVLTLIPPSKDIQILCVHHDCAIRRDDDSGNANGATFTVSLGDFYAEETRDILVEVTLAKPVTSCVSEKANNDRFVHLLATLSYTDILKKTPMRSPKHVLCFIERPDNHDVSFDNEYISKQWIRVHAAKEMEEAEKLAELGQFVDAKRRLQGVKDLIARADINVRNDVMVDQLAKDLQESMNGCVSSFEYDSYGSKHLAYHQQTYKRQRMSTANSLTKSPYRTSMKQQLAQEFYEQTAAKK